METYRLLIKGEYIKSCNNMLANGCQCRKAASFVVQKTISILDEGGEETPETVQVDTPFQVCNRCKVLLEAGYPTAPIMGVVDKAGRQTTGTVEVQMTYPVSKVDSPITEEKEKEKKENEKSTLNEPKSIK